MKILHLCLGNCYVDNQMYQENLLTKYHKVLGYDVEILASTQSFDDGKVILYDNRPGKYINEYGIPVTRLSYKRDTKFYHRFRKFNGLKHELEKSNPDILFIHNCQFLDISIVKQYLQCHKILAFVDNHADYQNSGTNWLSLKIQHGIIWKYCAHLIKPYVKKFYGVSPARVGFLENVYKLPKECCDLLVLGADDEQVNKAISEKTNKNIRGRFGISDNDFLVVTGGKINKYRPETLDLMRAVVNSCYENVKLLIFGNVSSELRVEFNELCKNSRIKYVGWISAEETYDYLAIGDLAVYPGLHSVLWEQSVALGIPCVFRAIEGFHHIDLGGNSILLRDVSEQSLKSTIEGLISNPRKLTDMKTCAQEKGMKVFSYKDIAKRSIEC